MHGVLGVASLWNDIVVKYQLSKVRKAVAGDDIIVAKPVGAVSFFTKNGELHTRQHAVQGGFCLV